MSKINNLKNDDLQKFRYPNLIAEFLEAGYSLCTLSEWMGYGRCEENDFTIKNKLYGYIDITIEEASKLGKLFMCDLDYLFHEKLKVAEDGLTYAHVRHQKNIAEEPFDDEGILLNVVIK